MKITPWYLAALAPFAAIGCSGAYLGHAAVVKRVIVADLLLIGCGLAAETGWGAASLGASVVIVAILLATLARGG